MGFSMGGMLVSSFLLTNPHINLNAVILVNPLMKVPDKAKLVGAKAFMIKSLGEDLNSLVTSSMLNATSLTKDSY
jgi:alpha-beta hydrolase superfamily lysophospholipase